MSASQPEATSAPAPAAVQLSPLETSLKALQWRARVRAGNASFGMHLAAGLLGVLSIPMAILSYDQFKWLRSYGLAGLGYVDYWPLLALLLMLGYAGVVLLTAHRLWNYYCLRAAYRLAQPGASELLADEELQRLLWARLPGRMPGLAAPTAQFKTLVERLEFCACHWDSLLRLARDSEALLPGLALDEWARRLTPWFAGRRSGSDGCWLSTVLPLVAPVYIAGNMLIGWRVVRSSAYLAVITKHLMQPYPPKLPPPAEPRGWWARTVAPWRTRA